jgi:uncharacterized protein YbaR (Trm112 family)
MRKATLEILRCPYCGGSLELVSSMFHRADAETIQDGILGCQCCIFPVVDGIPVIHLQQDAVGARAHIEKGHPELALGAMFGLESGKTAERFERAAGSPTATYREITESLGDSFEGGYFLYRFSDPTYVVADAVVRAVAGTVLDRRRALDVCGGSGHLTRSLLDLSSGPPVLADLFFVKVWLARRFTAPGCEPVCCDGNAPLPFARGAFGFAMCADAFQYIWTKRQFVGEMIRAVDDPEGRGTGAVVINHTRNSLVWSPSQGQPLSPAGYRGLFETLEPRLFGAAGLFDDVVSRGVVDLSRRDTAKALDTDPGLTIIATRHPGVFEPHKVDHPRPLRGTYRINPLYEATRTGNEIRLKLRFPSKDYEDEYGGCRQYLPEETTVDAAALTALAQGGRPPGLEELIRRRVIVDLPTYYY